MNILKKALNTAVIVAALGYFVDVYDLVLFLIVGKQSLADIGIAAVDIDDKFQFLLSIQMYGMLLGGIFWGVLGDKKGRLSVLFGSIITYSLANIANGFVINMEMYIVLRFIAGFGLAGELGAGITLVSEIMDKESRGIGTMLVAAIGVVGAVVAGFVGQIGWQISYFIGGGLGLSLLLLRVGVFESGMFEKAKDKVEMGNFFHLFRNKKIAFKYINCILIGLPVWFIIGILVGSAPKFAMQQGIVGTITNPMSVALCYAGLVFGDLASGLLSQLLRSRKKIFYYFYSLCIVFIVLYLNANGISNTSFYAIIFGLGFSVGFWAIFVTIGAEQFGTNLRATTTTTIPNFVRGSLGLIVILWQFCTKYVGLGLFLGTGVAALVVFSISFFALYHVEETFGKDLNYNE